MGYHRTYGLGIVAYNGSASGAFISRAIKAAGIAKPPILQSGPKITPGVIVPKTPVLTAPEADLVDTYVGIPPEMQFRYTPEQIREMRERGKSETMERSGESDGGMPDDNAMMQKSREASATEHFESSDNGAASVVAESPVKKYLPLIVAGVAAYYFM